MKDVQSEPSGNLLTFGTCLNGWWKGTGIKCVCRGEMLHWTTKNRKLWRATAAYLLKSHVTFKNMLYYYNNIICIMIWVVKRIQIWWKLLKKTKKNEDNKEETKKWSRREKRRKRKEEEKEEMYVWWVKEKEKGMFDGWKKRVCEHYKRRTSTTRDRNGNQ